MDDTNERNPFTTKMPLSHWHGQQTTILQLRVSKLDDTWISFHYRTPEQFMPLSIRTNTKSEKLFFSSGSQKFYKVTSDALYWSYYNAGPFQKMEAGVWMDLDPNRAVTEEDWEDVCTIKSHYKFNTLWGTMKRVPFEETEEGKNKDEEIPEERGAQEVSAKVTEILERIKELRKSDQPQEKKKEINDKAWEKCNALMTKLNNVANIISWKEAIMKGDGQPIPTIKTNQISNIFEEICEIYGIDYEINKVQLNTGTVGRPVEIFPTDSMNDVKFIMGIVLPELCLYPKTFVKDFSIDKIKMSGIFVSLHPIDTAAMINSNAIYLNTKERNMMKTQQSFHECMFERLLGRILVNIPQFEEYWKSLNVPDFTYDKTRKKVPKGIRGFLTLSGVISAECDMYSVYFALLKDPKTVLEHADIVIAKKAHFMKNVLSELCPEGIDDAWWGKVQNYQDIFELSFKSEGNLNKEIDEQDDESIEHKEVEKIQEAAA